MKTTNKTSQREQVRRRLLEAAIQIGDTLLVDAERQTVGLAWPSLAEDFQREPDSGLPGVLRKTFENLYVGSAGIAVFLMELAGQTGEERYLAAARAALDHAEHVHRTGSDSDHAFYMGRTGTAWALLQLHRHTGDTPCVDRALELVRGVEGFFELPGVRADLLYGVSGALLGLLHVYVATGETRLLRSIEQGLERLLDLAHVGPEGGVYWGRSRHTIQGLTGFSHGASGVAFALLELARQQGDEALMALAEQSLHYEETWFDAERENWLDLRKGIWTDRDYQEHRLDVLAGRFDFFVEPFEMVGWCNGASGIGLTRLRAWELTHREAWLEEALIALRKSAEMVSRPAGEALSGTLCHGSGGIAETFLEAHRVLGDDDYLQQAEQIGADILTARRAMGFYISGVGSSQHEDPTLFMGNAGIGYFFLRVLDPSGVPSVVAPRVAARVPNPEEVEAANMPTWTSMQRWILREPFRHCLSFLEAVIPEIRRDLLSMPPGSDESLQDRFVAGLEDRLVDLEEPVRKRVVDALTCDRARLALDRSIPSHSLLHIQHRVLLERAQGLLDEGLEGVELVWMPGVDIVTCCWPWPTLAEGELGTALSLAAGEHRVLLVARSMGVSESVLSDFEWLTLVAFRSPATLETAVSWIAGQVEIGNADSAQLASLIDAQVREALRAGLLVEAVLGWHESARTAPKELPVSEKP